MNPVIIRKILGKLQAAGIVETKAGVGGSSLAKKADEISLLDVYKAVSEEKESERSVFNYHSNPNPKCPVGSKIHVLLDQPLNDAQKALEEELKKTTIKDLLENL
jgi:DNA-binding IscR family transcriptional regulator